MYIIHIPYVCMIMCIAMTAILSALNFAGCVVVLCVGDGFNTTCNDTIALLTPNGVLFTFFFSFLLDTQSVASVGLMCGLDECCWCLPG